MKADELRNTLTDMAEYKINGKAIYTPKGAALEYGKVGCNFYTGCPHDCEYCYLKRGAPGKLLGSKEVRLKSCFKDTNDALEMFCKEARKHMEYIRKNGIFFSFTTDPLIAETIDLTISAMNFCIYNEIPVLVLTKDAGFVHNERMRLFLKYESARSFVSFGFTLTGRDDMESDASKNLERIEAMKELHTMGFRTFASIEPIVDWESSKKIIEKSLGVCDHYKIGLRSGVKKDYYNDEKSVTYISMFVQMITANNGTIYLKNSIRKLLEKTHSEGLLKGTLDMEGNMIS